MRLPACAVNHKVAKRPGYGYFTDRTHFALSVICASRSLRTFFIGSAQGKFNLSGFFEYLDPMKAKIGSMGRIQA
jgi:hypothetical protein